MECGLDTDPWPSGSMRMAHPRLVSPCAAEPGGPIHRSSHHSNLHTQLACVLVNYSAVRTLGGPLVTHPACTVAPSPWAAPAQEPSSSWVLALFLLLVATFSVGPRISHAMCPWTQCACPMSGGCSEFCCSETEVEEWVSDVRNLLDLPPKPPERILQSDAVDLPSADDFRDEAVKALVAQYRGAFEQQSKGFDQQYRLLEQQYLQRDREIGRTLKEIASETERITQEKIFIADAKVQEKSNYETRESWFTTGLGGLLLTNLIALLGLIFQRPSPDDRLLKKLEIDLRRLQLESARKGIHSSRWRRRA